MMRELPINPPEPREVATCAWCGGEIYEGDEVAYSNREGIIVHGGDCERKFAFEYTYTERGIVNSELNIE